MDTTRLAKKEEAIFQILQHLSWGIVIYKKMSVYLLSGVHHHDYICHSMIMISILLYRLLNWLLSDVILCCIQYSEVQRVYGR